MKLLCKVILAFMLCCFSATNSYSYEITTMENYGSTNYINEMAVHDTYLWCATSGGVVRWDLETLSHDIFTVNDGLGSNNVLCIAADNNGVVWAGTDHGLSRYDGTRWETFTTTDGLPYDEVHAIAIDSKSIVWIMTRSKNTAVKRGLLSRYDGEIWTTFTNYTHLFYGSITTDTDNNIWIGASGVYTYNGNRWDEYYDEIDNLCSASITSISVGSDGIVWAGGWQWLYRFDGVSWTKLRPYENIEINRVFDIALDSNNLPLITNGRLYHFKGQSWIDYELPDFNANRSVISVAITNDDIIFAGTEYGVYMYVNEKWTHLRTIDSLINNYIYSLAVAPDDALWIGTDGGLSCFDGKTWKSFDSENGLPSNQVIKVDIAPNGELWIATSKYNPDYVKDGTGISRYDGTDWTTFTTENGLLGNDCSALAVGPDGFVWVGTYNNAYDNNNGDYYITGTGLSKYDGNHWITIANNFRDYDYVRSIAVSQAGVVYYSTRIYIYEYNGVSFTKIKELDWPDALSLYVDHNDVLWMGNPDSIQQYSNGAWGTSYYGLDTPKWFAMSSYGVLWIGSSEYLHRIEGQEHEKYDLEEWDTNWTMPIAHDSHDVLWVGTGKGLLRIQDAEPTTVSSTAIHPSGLPLIANYPNPFNPSTTIEYYLDEPGKTILSIYDITGRKVCEFVSGYTPAGRHSILWDGCDSRGRSVSSGIYITRLKTPNSTAAHTMLLLK